MTQTTDTTSTDAVTPPAIGIVDLQNAINVIDYAAEQGAFKGWETIKQVIAIREKLDVFVKAALQAQQEAEGSADTTEQVATASVVETPVESDTVKVTKPAKNVVAKKVPTSKTTTKKTTSK
jgi:hypothetical protein